jgi:phosphate transport system substrate-binding protein
MESFMLQRRNLCVLTAGLGSLTACTKTPPLPPQQPPRVLVRLSGSNTIGADLAPALAESLAAKRATEIATQNGVKPDEVGVTGKIGSKLVSVEIKAHGSQTAFSDLAANFCDVGMSSRKIKDAEVAGLHSRGRGDLTSNSGGRLIARQARRVAA